MVRKICVIGCNRTGLILTTILSEMGNRVELVDDRPLLSAISKGELPFYDPVLSTAVSKNVLKRRIVLTTDLAKAVSQSDMIFISESAQTLKSGGTNLSKPKEMAESVGSNLKKGKNVVSCGRVPPGSTEKLILKTLEKKSGLECGKDFGLAICRIYLKDRDETNGEIIPERLIVGASRKKIADIVLSLFDGVDAKKNVADIRTVETLDYIAASIRANEISLANEIAGLCEAMCIDAREVMEILRQNSSRDIGLGYGDPDMISGVLSTLYLGESHGKKLDLLKSVKKVNDRQPMRAIELLKREIGNLRGKKIAILGLANSAGTDDADGSRAFDIAVALLAQGAKVMAYDPLAMPSFIKLLPGISYASTARDALSDADGCIIQTSDKEFSSLKKQDFDMMRNKTVIDGRRILSPAKVEKAGVKYRTIGLDVKGGGGD